jgi:membrane protease YdiL (CAAX protease family)
MNTVNQAAGIGFLVLFLLYQLAEASGQDLLRLPKRPYSTFGLFLLMILATIFVAYALGENGLSAFSMGLHPGWWQSYLLGLAAGLLGEGLFEIIGVRLGIRQVHDFRLSLRGLAGAFLWIWIGNFPAAAAEDLITRGYPFHFLYAAPLGVFLLISVVLYLFNHIIRLVTKPISDWYHLPLLGLILAYVLARTGSLWPVIGLHQSGNIIAYLMNQTMRVQNSPNLKKRMAFGAASQLVLFALVVSVLQ